MKQRIFFFGILCLSMFVGASCSDDDSSSDKTYKVGDLYNKDGVKGIVYKLTDASAKHGLIVSLDQTQAAWGPTDRITGATSSEDGAANQAVIAAISGWQTSYPAFAWCAAKNKNGVSGWFLPAYDQLYALYLAWSANPTAFDKSLTDNGGVAISGSQVIESYYWSSSEDKSTGASYSLAYIFAQNVWDYPLKSEVHNVRAVYRF